MLSAITYQSWAEQASWFARQLLERGCPQAARLHQFRAALWSALARQAMGLE